MEYPLVAGPIRSRNPPREGGVVSRSLKILKFAVVAAIAVGIGTLVIENVYFNPHKGIGMRGELEVSWAVPTENLDSSPLTDLSGYTIYCWSAEDHDAELVVIQDPAITSYELDHLQPGTYQCAVSAVTSSGEQSALSNIVTRTVP